MESERSGWYRKIVDGEQNHREKSPLLIDQRVIWFDDDGCEHGGYVRWIGKLQEMGDDWIAGVELDEPAGKNDGAWGSLRLFSTRPNHGLIINVNALMKEEEYVDESSFNDNFYLPKTDLVDCRPKISTDTRRKIESSREKMEYDEQFSFPHLNSEEKMCGVRSSGTYALQVAASIASGDICSALILRSDSHKQKLSGGSGKDQNRKKHSLPNVSSFSTLVNSRASSIGDTLKRSSKEKRGIFAFFQWFRRKKLKRKKSYCFPDDGADSRRRSCSVHSDTSISSSFHYVPMVFNPTLSTGNSPIGAKKIVIKKGEKSQTQIHIESLEGCWRERCVESRATTVETTEVVKTPKPVRKTTMSNTLQLPLEKSKSNDEYGEASCSGIASPQKSSVRRSSTSALRKKKRRAPQPPLKQTDSENTLVITPLANDSLNKKVAKNLRQMARLKKKRRAPSPPYKSIGINTENNQETINGTGNYVVEEDKSNDVVLSRVGRNSRNENEVKVASTQVNAATITLECSNVPKETVKSLQKSKTTNETRLNDLSKLEEERREGVAQGNGNLHQMSEKWKETNKDTQKLINMFSAMAMDDSVDRWNIPVCNGNEGSKPKKESSTESDEQNVSKKVTPEVDLNETMDDNFVTPVYANVHRKNWDKSVRNLDEVEACIEALTSSFSDDHINEEKGLVNAKKWNYSKNDETFQELRIYEGDEQKKPITPKENFQGNFEEAYENAPVQGKIFRPKARRNTINEGVIEGNCISHPPFTMSPKQNNRKMLDIAMGGVEENVRQLDIAEAQMNCESKVDYREKKDVNFDKSYDKYERSGARPRHPQRARSYVFDDSKRENHVSKIRCNIASNDSVHSSRKTVKSFSASFTAANTNKSRSLDTKRNGNPNSSSQLNVNNSFVDDSCDVYFLQPSSRCMPTKQVRKHRKHCPLPSGKNETQDEFTQEKFKGKIIEKCIDYETEKVVPPRRTFAKKHRKEVQKLSNGDSSSKDQTREALKRDKITSSVKNNVSKTVPNIVTCSSMANEMTDEERVGLSLASKSLPDEKKYCSDKKQTPPVNSEALKCLSKGQLWPLSYEILAPELARLRARLTGQQPSGTANSCHDVTLMNDRNAVEINKLLVQLELAISNGLVEQASQLARKLASIKVKCSVVRKKSSPPASYKNISINLFVEDRTSHIGPITLDINPLMTIGQLKKKIEGEFQFPASLQRWIIGKKLASNDNASISSFDITSSGCPVFLYLTVDDASVTDMYKQKLETYLRALDDFDNGSGDSGTGNDDCSPEYFDCVEGDANERNSYYGLPLKQPTSTSEIVETKQEGWTCPSCTLINVPTRPGCSACGVARPEDYVIPAEYKLNDEEERRLQLEKEMDEAYRIELDKYKVENYQRLVDLDNVDVVLNDEKFECVVCFCEVDIGEGVRIRECLHTFCRDCIARTIEHSETAEVKCPYRDDNYSCPATMQDREIRALVTKEVYERHLQKSIAAAENQADNSFHCKTANCAGWCFYEDENNVFNCPVCLHNNCLTCQAIHEELNCKQYQDKLEYEATTNENAKKTKDALDTMLNRGEAMRCPKCQVIIMKKWGCDWLCCTMCRTEICWVTKGPRWGPAGKGDTNGGCRCGVTGVRCHPQCNYCH